MITALIIGAVVSAISISTVCLMKCAKEADEDIEKLIQSIEKRRLK